MISLFLSWLDKYSKLNWSCNWIHSYFNTGSSTFLFLGLVRIRACVYCYFFSSNGKVILSSFVSHCISWLGWARFVFKLFSLLLFLELFCVVFWLESSKWITYCILSHVVDRLPWGQHGWVLWPRSCRIHWSAVSPQDQQCWLLSVNWSISLVSKCRRSRDHLLHLRWPKSNLDFLVKDSKIWCSFTY